MSSDYGLFWTLLEEDADERVRVKGLVNAHEWKEILRKSRR